MGTVDPISGGVISSGQFGVPVADDVQGYIENATSDYSGSLVITGGITNPTKGNSTYVARYRYLNPHTIFNTVFVTIGSTWGVGSSQYFFSLPVAPADTEGYGAIGQAFVIAGASPKEYMGWARITLGKVVLYIPTQDGTTTTGHSINASQVGSGMGWATGNRMCFSHTYEV